MPLLYVSNRGRTQIVRTNRRGRVTARIRNPIPGGHRMTALQRFRYRVNRALMTGRSWLARNRRIAGGY